MAVKRPKTEPLNNGKSILPVVGTSGKVSPRSGAPLPVSRGRPKGSQNVLTKRLKHALFLAAEVKGDITPKRKDNGELEIKNGKVVLLNDDGTGDRFVDYMCFLAAEHPVTFAHMLSRYIPAEIKLEEKHAPEPQQVFEHEEEVVAFLRKRGKPEAVAREVAKSIWEAKRKMDA